MSGSADAQLPPWWPRGADETIVRDCGCSYCDQLVAKLEQHRDGRAIDGEHMTIEAFVGGED